jgi:hypothetical protein
MAGGTKLRANNMAPVPTVTAAPNATPATTTSATPANHTWINLDRVMSFSIVFTLRGAAFLHEGQKAPIPSFF